MNMLETNTIDKINSIKFFNAIMFMMILVTLFVILITQNVFIMDQLKIYYHIIFTNIMNVISICVRPISVNYFV